MEAKQDNYSNEEIAQASELFPSLWVKKYGIKNESGIPIEFYNHFFLRDFYDDMSPLQVVLKPPTGGIDCSRDIKIFLLCS